MAIETYEDLQESVAGWLLRQDLEAVIPDFIAMAEAEFNRSLRTQDMISRSRARVIDQFISLPTDWLEAWNVQTVDPAVTLEYLPPASIDIRRREWRGQRVRAYSIIGRTMELAPTPEPDTVDLEMVYFKAIPALSRDVPQNWLLRKHPDIYLYGALVHSAPYLVDDDRVGIWQQQLDRRLATLSESESRARRSGAPLKRPIRGGA